MRQFIAIVISGAVALIAPALAGAIVPSAGVSAQNDPFSGAIDITGSGEDNQASLSYIGGETYRLSDQAGAVGSFQCQQVDAATTDCTNPATYLQVSYIATAGNDDVTFDLAISGAVTALGGDGSQDSPAGDDDFEMTAASLSRARFSGYRGDDVLVGAVADDFLSGGRGNDLLKGGPGNDRLLGAQQPDTFIGGPGNDRIEAVHHDRDAVIRCGPGDDVAIIDRDLDPKPKGCEKVELAAD